MQSAFQEKCSYTMAVRGLLDGGSVTVRRMKAFGGANEKLTGYHTKCAVLTASSCSRRIAANQGCQAEAPYIRTLRYSAL